MPDIDKRKLIRNRLAEARKSPLKTYRILTVGDRSTGFFLLYEAVTFLFGPLGGGLGLLLRRKLYRYLFAKMGRGVIIGRNVVFRNPGKILIGDNVTIDDNCLLDGRGGDGVGIVIGDKVVINRNCMVQAKGGTIRIGARTTIGSNSVIVATDGAHIGEAVMLAGGCYVSAGAYAVDGGGPMMDQPMYSRGPIVIGDGAWLGTCAIVLDGANVGSGAVIGAGAVVNCDIPENSIAVGVPARVVRQRQTD